MLCNICEHDSRPFATAKLLHQYDVQYYRCVECGFVQTETPYWIDEAYTDPINESDVGLVSRNISFSRVTSFVISAFFDADARFMDYGGGYGLFVRLMRDMGFDFYRL